MLKHTISTRALLALVLSLMLAPAVARADEPRNADEATLRQMIAAQEEAWNHHDAKAWCKDFAPDADFVNIVGMVLTGKAEIEKRHAGIFATVFKDSQTRVTVRRLVFVTPEVAIVDTDHEVTGHKALPGVQNTEAGVLRTRMRYVLRKTAGKWQIVAGQNTDVKPAPPAANPQAPSPQAPKK